MQKYESNIENNNISSIIEKNKKNFILHNIVRLREMIRYLPSEKLTLFQEIPFLVHINSPDFPGYVKISNAESAAGRNSSSNIFGVWNFENSGFAKDLSKNNLKAKELLSCKCKNPVVQAVYHIGSLGTFTQSAKSDFDFWVVIDSETLSDDEYLINILHEKLALITTYSRKEFSQEVTFFVHYSHNLRKNIFDNPDDEDSVAVPELLLKEEFYRTFIMVAGKIPLWAVEPLDIEPEKKTAWKKSALEYDESLIDLGSLDYIPIKEIQRGLLWQICKAPYDPVKSVIKASITASYHKKNNNIKDNTPILLCDMVKERFGKSIIDDYAADPYIIAFERILKFYNDSGDQRAIAQIKAAVFFRLCGFPLVTLPSKDSPKRKILDNYIKKWQLSGARLKKLLDYQQWSEPEKMLFDKTMIDRLNILYKRSLQKQDIKEPIEDISKNNDEIIIAEQFKKTKRDLKILKNKADKILLHNNKQGVLPKSSTYLNLKPHSQLVFIYKNKHKDSNMQNSNKNADARKQDFKEWLVFSKVENIQNTEQNKTQYNFIYSSEYFFKSLGWCMYNHIYIRGTTQIEIKTPLKLYGSLEKQADCDDIYLTLQPWMPLSDEPFSAEPFCEKIIVLIVAADETINNKISVEPKHAEFLIRNSWGEIFFEVLRLEQFDNIEKKCYQTAMKILQYYEKNSNYSIFQTAAAPIPKLIQKIKTIVEDKKFSIINTDAASSNKQNVNKNNYSDSDINIIQRRPYLDII